MTALRNGPIATAAVELRGELDLATLPAVESLLDAALDNGSGDVVVDVSAVRFVDSQTISALVAARARAAASGRSLSLRGVGPRFARVLELYRPHPEFVVAPPEVALPDD